MTDKILLFLWLPLSIGMMDALNTHLATSVSYQHIVMLAFPIYAIIKAGQSPSAYLIRNNYFYSIFFFMVIHSIFISSTINTYFRLFLYFGSAQWAYYIVKKLDQTEFFDIMASSAAFFLIASILFGFIFPSASFEELQGKNGMSSFYGHKNSYGRFLQISTLIFFGAFAVNKQIKWLTLYIISFCILYFFASSRTSFYIAVIGSFVGILTTLGYFTSLKALLIWISVSLIVWIGTITGDVYSYRMGSIYDGVNIFGLNIDLTGRLTVWNSLINYLSLEKLFLFGNGYGDFFNSTANIAASDIGIGDFIPHDAHNGYIDTLVSFGIIGLMVFLSFIFSCFVKFKNIHNTNPILAIFFLPFIFCFVFVNLTEAYIIKTTNIYSFLIWCLYFSDWKQVPNNYLDQSSAIVAVKVIPPKNQRSQK